MYFINRSLSNSSVHDWGQTLAAPKWASQIPAPGLSHRFCTSTLNDVGLPNPCLSLHPPPPPGGSEQVVVANVGDSRAVLSRGGRAIDLSAEHRVWGKTPAVISEIQRIESVGGWVDDGRVCGVLAVSRWVAGAAPSLAMRRGI